MKDIVKINLNIGTIEFGLSLKTPSEKTILQTISGIKTDFEEVLTGYKLIECYENQKQGVSFEDMKELVSQLKTIASPRFSFYSSGSAKLYCCGELYEIYKSRKSDVGTILHNGEVCVESEAKKVLRRLLQFMSVETSEMVKQYFEL